MTFTDSEATETTTTEAAAAAIKHSTKLVKGIRPNGWRQIPIVYWIWYEFIINYFYTSTSNLAHSSNRICISHIFIFFKCDRFVFVFVFFSFFLRCCWCCFRDVLYNHNFIFPEWQVKKLLKKDNEE